jgi:hypothetical protein
MWTECCSCSAPAMIIGLDILAGGGEDGVLGMAFDATRRIWMPAA